MAIDAQLIGSKGTIRQAEGLRAEGLTLPPVVTVSIVAAGFTDLTADAEVYWFHNFSTSQRVYIRLNLDSDNTAASSADNKSVGVDPGETLPFGLVIDTDATGYKLSVA